MLRNEMCNSGAHPDLEWRFGSVPWVIEYAVHPPALESGRQPHWSLDAERIPLWVTQHRPVPVAGVLRLDERRAC